MKRIHLFEFEDQSWFPNLLRDCMTRYINTFHKLLGTPEELAKLYSKVISKTNTHQFTDLCSGGGWLTEKTMKIVRKKYPDKNIKAKLTDLYPNKEAAEKINSRSDNWLSYHTQPINAATYKNEDRDILSMNCSMHHMEPSTAQSILQNSVTQRSPIIIFEISDNSAPKAIWWLPIFIVPIMVFFITPFIRPLKIEQLIFTYIIPILPFLIAWDGAVSNIRTYTSEDYKELLNNINSEDYTWESGKIKGKGGNRSYLIGMPG